MRYDHEIYWEEFKAFASQMDEEDFAMVFSIILNRACEMQGENNCKGCRLGSRYCREIYDYIRIMREKSKVDKDRLA